MNATNWLRTHITKQELANRFTVGDKLIKEQQTRRKTELDWQQCVEEKHITRDQAQRYMKIAKRFSPKQRERIIDLELPWRFVEFLARDGLSNEHVDRFLSTSSTRPSIDQCLSLLYKIIYAQDTLSASSTLTKDTALVFLSYLEDTIRAMRLYLAKQDK